MFCCLVWSLWQASSLVLSRQHSLYCAVSVDIVSPFSLRLFVDIETQKQLNTETSVCDLAHLLSGWWKPMQKWTRAVSHDKEVMTCEIGAGVCIGRWLRFDTVSCSHTGGSLKPMPFDLGDSQTEILYLSNCRTWTKFTLSPAIRGEDELRLWGFFSERWSM